MLKKLGVFGWLALFAAAPVGCVAAGDDDEDPEGVVADDDEDAGDGKADDDEGDDDAADDDCEGDECYFDLDAGSEADAGPSSDDEADAGEQDAGEWDGGSGGAVDELDLPDYPPEDEVDETVGGVDDNENGLRDDVERDLGVEYWPDEDLIKIINELVKDDQQMITNPDDSDIVSDSLERKKLALGCLELHLEGDMLKVLEVTGNIAAHMLDTPERLAAARAVDAKLGGQVVTLPTDAEVERFCQGLLVPGLAVDPAEAATENPAACRTNEKTIVTYSNSLLQRHDKAIVNGMALRQLVRENDAANNSYIYKLAFNDSESTYGAEGSTDMYGEFESVSELITSSAEWMEAFNHFQSGAASMPEWLRASLESSDGPVFAVTPEDVQGHATSISSDVTVGNRVLLVAHGAGALVANAAYANVIGSLPDVAENIRIIAVGTPADSVAGDPDAENYVTDEGDLILSLLAPASAAAGDAGAAPSGSLPANVENDEDTEPSGHEFLVSYLRGDAAGPELKALLDTAIDEVEAPVAIGTDGIITVTLAWGEQPDVDLHATEPNGAHVYYGSARGPSGFLDVDDTTSFGPEHYTVSCGTLEEGTYEIGVNYFSGSGPETATVNVAAGSQSRTFTIELTTAIASQGDNSPIPVADIVVTEGENGFLFQVVDRTTSED